MPFLRPFLFSSMIVFGLLDIANATETEVHAGFMLQGVFDSKNDRGCKQGAFHCGNGAFPMEDAIHRLCRIPNPVFSVGWQTMGMDRENFHHLVRRVRDCRPNVVVRVSFEHGPARPPRAWKGYWTFERSLDVGQFNRQIARSGALKGKFKRYLTELKRETTDRYPDVSFIFFGIEDNFDCPALTSIHALWKQVFRGVASAEFMRNRAYLGKPCALDKLLRQEVHGPTTIATVSKLRAGDFYCPDGAFHAVPGDSAFAMNPAPGRPKVASYGEAERVMRFLRARGVWFEQWYPELQAISREEHSQAKPPHRMGTVMRFLDWNFDRRLFEIHQGKAME